MVAALLLVLFREIWGWDHNPKQLNNQHRGSHRRVGNAPWAALAGCIVPLDLFGHTSSGLHARQAAVAGVESSRDPSYRL